MFHVEHSPAAHSRNAGWVRPRPRGAGRGRSPRPPGRVCPLPAFLKFPRSPGAGTPAPRLLLRAAPARARSGLAPCGCLLSPCLLAPCSLLARCLWGGVRARGARPPPAPVGTKKGGWSCASLLLLLARFLLSS